MSDSASPRVVAPYFEEQDVAVMSVYSTDPAWTDTTHYFALGTTYLIWRGRTFSTANG